MFLHNLLQVGTDEIVMPQWGSENIDPLFMCGRINRPSPHCGVVREKLQKRFELFSAGQWEELIGASQEIANEASVVMRRQRRRPLDDGERRAAKAHMLVQLGELSAGRAALEAADLVLGTDETLQQLRNPVRSPPRPREPIPNQLLEEIPRSLFELDEAKFLQNVRKARRGVAAGPSGMTSEHTRVLLDNPRDSHLFFLLGEQLSQAMTPEGAVQAVRLGRLTALSKRDGGVRGIVAGDVVRRFVARTMAQQLGDAVMAATAPFQYALSTRAGCECIAHALQAITEMDPNATVLSIDGIGAFDLISRGSMLQGLHNVAPSALPFVRQFYGSPSQYLWEDDMGTVHEIDQGKGGEQGDPMMPLFFSPGQHAALQFAQEQLGNARVFAFLDDVWVVSPPDRVSEVYATLQTELWRHSRIRVHDGKTQVGNRGGIRPPGCDVLDVVFVRTASWVARGTVSNLLFSGHVHRQLLRATQFAEHS